MEIYGEAEETGECTMSTWRTSGESLPRCISIMRSGDAREGGETYRFGDETKWLAVRN